MVFPEGKKYTKYSVPRSYNAVNPQGKEKEQ